MPENNSDGLTHTKQLLNLLCIVKLSYLLPCELHFFISLGTEYATAVRIRRTRRITKPKPGRTKIPTTKVKVRNYYGQRYKSSYWKTGMAVGLVYGIASYKTRRRYLRYPDRGNYMGLKFDFLVNLAKLMYNLYGQRNKCSN